MRMSPNCVFLQGMKQWNHAASVSEELLMEGGWEAVCQTPKTSNTDGILMTKVVQTGKCVFNGSRQRRELLPLLNTLTGTGTPVRGRSRPFGSVLVHRPNLSDSGVGVSGSGWTLRSKSAAPDVIVNVTMWLVSIYDVSQYVWHAIENSRVCLQDA